MCVSISLSYVACTVPTSLLLSLSPTLPLLALCHQSSSLHCLLNWSRSCCPCTHSAYNDRGEYRYWMGDILCRTVLHSLTDSVTSHPIVSKQKPSDQTKSYPSLIMPSWGSCWSADLIHFECGPNPYTRQFTQSIPFWKLETYGTVSVCIVVYRGWSRLKVDQQLRRSLICFHVIHSISPLIASHLISYNVTLLTYLHALVLAPCVGTRPARRQNTTCKQCNT